jgi:quercetin dioxygenase-like cupin family protein
LEARREPEQISAFQAVGIASASGSGLAMASVVHDFCRFLVLLSAPGQGRLGRQKRTTIINLRFVIIAACLAVATSAATQTPGEAFTPNFEHAIPNIPGKSLVAMFVDYAPGGASRTHTHAKSAFIYTYVVSGTIESQVKDGPKRVYHAGESFYELPASAATRAPGSPQSYSRCSSSI